MIDKIKLYSLPAEDLGENRRRLIGVSLDNSEIPQISNLEDVISKEVRIEDLECYGDQLVNNNITDNNDNSYYIIYHTNFRYKNGSFHLDRHEKEINDFKSIIKKSPEENYLNNKKFGELSEGNLIFTIVESFMGTIDLIRAEKLTQKKINESKKDGYISFGYKKSISLFSVKKDEKMSFKTKRDSAIIRRFSNLNELLKFYSSSDVNEFTNKVLKDFENSEYLSKECDEKLDILYKYLNKIKKLNNI